MVGNMETAESEVLHVLHLSFWMVFFLMVRFWDEFLPKQMWLEYLPKHAK